MADLGLGPVASGAVSSGNPGAAPAVGAGNLGLGAVASGAVGSGNAGTAVCAFGGSLGFGMVAGAPVAAITRVCAIPPLGVVGIIRASQVVMEVLMLSARRNKHLRPYLQINI